MVAIICENKNACEEAKNLVEVEYEELPHTTDPREALKDSAPVINENFSNNIAYQTTFGDKEATEDVFKNAYMVVNLNFHNQRLAAITLEPRGSIALVDNGSKRTFLYTSCQNPAGFQNALANVKIILPEKTSMISSAFFSFHGSSSIFFPWRSNCFYSSLNSSWRTFYFSRFFN